MPILLFVVILTVVAGLVAAAGDRMGHRAARRKLRIGRLRPRTVSTIIAVVTGILISLVTFGVVFAVWQDFGEALLRYGEVKQSLAQAQGELTGMQDEVEQAEAERKAALAESEAANSQLSAMREQTIELAKAIDTQQQELDAKLAQVSRLQRQIGALEQEKTKLGEDIDSYEARMNDLRDLFAQARTERETYLESDVLIPRGTYLAYQVVHAGEEGGLQTILQGALNRVNVNLSKDGLAIDPESAAAAEAFIAGYDQAGDAVVVISAARNVFEGTDVLLEFAAQPLSPLLEQGAVVMDINIGSSTASIRTAAGGRREITVPATFSVDSLTDFSVILQNEMVAMSQALGFLPDLRSGEYATPVGMLAQVADDIMARERPFVIQFVAKRPLNALDGLADVEIYISNPK